MTTHEWDLVLKRFHRNNPAKEDAIKAFEHEANFTIPREYREFLTVTDGGEGFLQDESFVQLWPVDELVSLNKAYQIEEYCPGLLLYGSTGGGEAFAFDRRSKSAEILALPFIGMEESAIEKVAPDFAAFIKGSYFMPDLSQPEPED